MIGGLAALHECGFATQRFEWSGHSRVSVQIRMEDFYREFPSRAVPADVHGILTRVASLEDTLAGKLQAFRDPQRRPSKRQKDLTDIARLIEAHPALRARVPADVLGRIVGEGEGTAGRERRFNSA